MRKNWILIKILLKTVCLLFAICLNPFAEGQSRYSAVKGAYSFEDHLKMWGEEFDCYFTLEEQYYPLRNSDWFSQIAKIKAFDSIEGIGNIDELVAQLRKLLPFAEVIRDDSNGAVIHIIERQLQKIKGYPLGVSTNMKFKGELYPFIKSLGSMFPEWNFDFKSGTTPYISFSKSMIPPFQIDAKRKLLRNIITDYLPLQRLERVIWSATTSEGNHGFETAIRYHDPITLAFEGSDPFYGFVFLDSDSEQFSKVNPNELLEYSYDESHRATTKGTLPGKSFKFSDGQVAWAFNNDEPRVHQKAMDYIEKHAGEGVSSQVRWSMLYLSKHKDLKAIPLLLKHIDELYSPVPVRETAYPAVEALTALGVPAAKAAESALKKETDSKRIELLSWTILNVYGREEGVKRLAAVLDETDSSDLLKRLKLSGMIDTLNSELLLFERLAAETKKAQNN